MVSIKIWAMGNVLMNDLIIQRIEGPGDGGGEGEVRGVWLWVRFFDRRIHRNPGVMFGGETFPLD